jgi:serine/threonine-protein kinase
MGSVYKALDVSLQRQVAVKVLPAALAADQTYVRRFVREARALAKLSHPNLAHVYNVGQKDGLYYFAMEYVRGRTLHQVIRSDGPLTVAAFLRCAGQVLAALHKIHAAGLTHRDVKSSNVVVEEGTGRAVLMDFGLAKDRSAQDGEAALTSAGVVLGTPEYMSPEQAESREVDARSDVYSFGIMAYEMLAGAVPFTGKSAIAVLRQQIETPPPPLRRKRADLPAEIETAVKRALAKAPGGRQASASELAADLVRAGHTPELADLAAAELPATARTIVGPLSVGGAPGMPTEPTLRAPAQPAGRRRHLALVLAGSGVLLLVLLLVLVIVGRRTDGNGTGNGKVPPPPPPVAEPGMVGELVSRDDKRFRVRILEIDGVVARVRVLPAGGSELGPEILVDLRKFKGFQADPTSAPVPTPATPSPAPAAPGK